jgi:signal transduction histidine kinase
MDIQGISVKLLAEDGRRLRYAASHGLPARFAPGREVDLDKSPLNRRIIEGEPYTAGHVTDGDLFQLGEEYAAARIKSVLFVPLRAGDRVIGILGAYARETDRFGADEQEFLRLAAELTAIALENARAYQAVEELGAERERFAYRVAHNLRAPLAAMVSMVDVLRDGYAGEMGEKQRQYLERIRARATALGSLVNELLVLASAQSGLREEPRAPVSLADVVASVFATFTEKCAERRLALSLDVEEGLPPIIGMATKLEQMLENLVSNAVKYTAPGGTVTIRLHGSDGDCTAPAGTSGHWLCLVVEDDGIGIPAAAQEKLFTEFYRAENARAMEAIGTGLGLVIVRDIARTHGGRVDLWSEEGRGTRFTVRLPVN